MGLGACGSLGCVYLGGMSALGLFGEERAVRVDRYARIAIERGLDRAAGLTYGIPVEMGNLRVGERVRVPLGRGNGLADGYVVEVGIDPEIDPGKIKAIRSRLSPEAVGAGGMSEVLVGLAAWMSGYYCCPMGMVLATMVPAAVKKQTGRVVRTLVERSGGEPITAPKGMTGAAWEAIKALGDDTFPLGAKDLAALIGQKNAGPVNRLLKMGVLREVRRASVRTASGELPRHRESTDVPDLTDAQTNAVDAINTGLGTPGGYLLFGITGSGKTEVYLRVIERVLERGESAIVLVPEISLTPQTSGRFLARFRGAGVAVLHSGLTASQRHAEWARVSSGDAQVVIGARSAVFAPISTSAHKLGVIIVDEEHDGSYKQDQLPRYHARDVALKRGHMEGCPVVLGSATPSLESWQNARRGRFTLLELPDRVGGGRLPKVEIIDIAREWDDLRRGSSRERSMGNRLRHALGQTLERGGQAILLLNKRGYSTVVCCTDSACGWKLECDQCSVLMVQHKSTRAGADGFVRCHHCLAQQLVPRVCPLCENKAVRRGFGTQRVEDELRDGFPALAEEGALVRVDSDTMQRAADYFRVLDAFREGRARVMLGTQMIAKGLDFPGVELIGVINADTALSMPDFRASERTYQLVSQVAGRAGRGAASGSVARVIVQTMQPDERAIRCAARHDYVSFADRELATREAALLPPAWRMARVVCRDADAHKAAARAQEVCDALQGAAHSAMGRGGARIFGPMECPIARIAGRFRVGIEVYGESAAVVQGILASARSMGVVKSDARTAVDVDPVALL